jgi:hypothetical protein
MAKKNITFRIDEEIIEKFNHLRGNLSQNAFLEQLITSTSTSTSTSTKHETDPLLAQLQVQADLLANLQSQVQLLVQANKQPTSTSTSTSKSEPKQKQKAVSSGIDWDNIEIDGGGNSSDFYYETRIDEDGNEYQIRLVKPEAIYGKIPPAGTRFDDDYDPEDPIEKMIREQEEKYGKK